MTKLLPEERIKDLRVERGLKGIMRVDRCTGKYLQRV